MRVKRLSPTRRQEVANHFMNIRTRYNFRTAKSFFDQFYFDFNDMFINIMGVTVVKRKHKPNDRSCWQWFDKIDGMRTKIESEEWSVGREIDCSKI